MKEAIKNRDSYGGTSPEKFKKELIFSKEKWCNDQNININPNNFKQLW